MKQSDILVLGSGIAGLTFALKMAKARPDLKVTALTKTDESESNTAYAQGGVAAVWDVSVDSYEKHIEDTLIAGDGLCDEEIVRIVVEEAPERVSEIINWGARFDKKTDEHYDLGREGGHSENRILHFKDVTGWELQRTLLSQVETTPNLEVLEYYFAIDLITQHHLGYTNTRVTPGIECYGTYALNKKSGQIETLLARVTVVTTGGAGQVYRNTTNPVIATGDGIAMMYRAKGRIENMEFVQFHPTALYNPHGDNPAFLISEAVRGFGAELKTPAGEPFMRKYDQRGSLAPRDIVARAIDREMKILGVDFMCLDCRHLEKEAFVAHFPNIYEKCRSIGIDPMRDTIPVTPACHYMCGGIRTDAWGRTSIKHLYAAGECTCTGLHGANRLASNSLIEAMVFAHRIHLDALKTIDERPPVRQDVPKWDARGTTEPDELVLIVQSIKELKDTMSYYVGIVRSDERLKRASDRMFLLYRETEELYTRTALSPQLCELRNLITIAYLIIRSATMRKESRGLHYTTDYPDKLDFIDHTIL